MFCRFNEPAMAIFVVFSSSIGLSSFANAQDLGIKILSVKGKHDARNCNLQTVSSSAAGDDAAILLSDFSLRLPSISKNSFRGSEASCVIKGQLLIPRGYYAESATGIMTYGLVKEVGISAELEVEWEIKFPSSEVEFEFEENFSRNAFINEPLITKAQTRSISIKSRRSQCKTTSSGVLVVPFTLALEAEASQKKKSFAAMDLGVDSLDLSVPLRVNLAPCNSIR